MKAQFEVGTQFVRHSKPDGRVETVIDIYTTRNLAGDIVKLRYVCVHDYLGQQVVDYDVPGSTIARSQKVEAIA